MASNAAPPTEAEYIVVGSGAGGGTVAARLAEAGHTVIVLEAGGDPIELKGDAPLGKDRMPEDYHVPVFHFSSTENTAMSWEFFCRHYESEERQQRDPKYVPDQRGVFYPRAGTLGGCTAHNAMIMVYPHNEDWDYVAYLTGDHSWNAENMRRYFERLEECRHRFFWYRWLAWLGFNITRHGWSGWLSIEKAVPKSAFKDPVLMRTIARSAIVALKLVRQPARRIWWFFRAQLDPNDWRVVRERGVGLRYPPLMTRDHARGGSRERLLDVQRRYPERLTIELDALATRVLFDADNRAVGIEYLKGAHLYQAHPDHSLQPGERREMRVSREVILAGGAFNTPQLLMLSGIGPPKHLEEHGIEVRVDLPGVGRNLQDRYEVSVINRMKSDWKVLEGARFAKGDPQYQEWEQKRKGLYTTNGAMLAVIKRGDPHRVLPDLFCFAAPGKFRGYFPGYSKLLLERNYLTWTILKAHTNNSAGRVTLRSSNPLERPEINFRYFDEGNDESKADLAAVVDGVEFVRKVTAQMSDLIEEEELPGKDKQTPEQLADFVKSHAWGHHASCTCPIGPPESGGVLNSSFEVHGTRNLRVVDASVFPKIPGFFILSAVYMIGEKAADVILAAANKPLPAGEGRAPRGIWKLLGVGLAAVVVAVVLIVVLIIGASYFYFEPRSAPKDLADERRVIANIEEVLTDTLERQYDPRFFRRDTHPKANACVRANFIISVADEGRSVGNPLTGQRHVIAGWQRIGKLTFDNAVASYNGDFVLHFHHPPWRRDRNDPGSVARVDGKLRS